MKTVHIKLFFPRNWYHARRLKLYHEGEQIAYIMHNDSLVLQLPQEATTLHWKLDYFRNSIELPKEETSYLILFMNVGEGIIQLYLKTLRRKCIQGKFVSQEEFENSTSTTIYQSTQTWLPITKIDRPILYIGLLIGVISLLYSIYAQTDWSAILFLLGGGTIVSLLILIFEKNRVPMGDYKSRMWASVGCFILIILMIPRTDHIVQILVTILTVGFILRFLYHIRKLHVK